MKGLQANLISKKHSFVNNSKSDKDYDQQHERLRKRKCFADKELEEITPTHHHRLIKEKTFETQSFQDPICDSQESESTNRSYRKNVLFSLDQTFLLQYCSAIFAHFLNEQQTNLVKAMAVSAVSKSVDSVSCSEYNSLEQVSIMKGKNSRVNNFSVESLLSYGD